MCVCVVCVCVCVPSDSQSLDHYGLTDGVKIFLTHRPAATSTPVTASSVSADSSRPHPQLNTAGHEAVDMETDGEERVVLMVKVLKGGREEKVEVRGKVGRFEGQSREGRYNLRISLIVL